MHSMKYIKSFVTEVQQYVIQNFYVRYFHLKINRHYGVYKHVSNVKSIF